MFKNCAIVTEHYAHLTHWHCNPMELTQKLHLFLKRWHKPSTDNSPLNGLLVVKQAQNSHADAIAASKQVILSAMAELRQHSEVSVDLLHERFVDNQKVHTVACKFDMSAGTFYERMKIAVQELASVIQVRENESRQLYRFKKQASFPNPVDLVGVEVYLDRLYAHLVSADPPWLIAIEGKGGSGKTALAATLAQRIIDDFTLDDFAWVSIDQQHDDLQTGLGPAGWLAVDLVTTVLEQLGEVIHHPTDDLDALLYRLETRLKAERCLVVIDNIEQTHDIQSLLPALDRMTNPSKILLTSRASLQEYGVFSVHLPELTETLALDLLRQEAHHCNLPALAEAPSGALQRIYDAVGGNPLALQVVAQQTSVYSLDVVLARLSDMPTSRTKQLYDSIFENAWQSLSDDERQVWLAMALVSDEGAPLDLLQATIEVDDAVLINALDTLVRLNLIDSVGGLNDRQYTIHELTRAFLRSKISPNAED